MASNDYDDLLKSFMSNSTKAYNEDKTSRETAVMFLRLILFLPPMTKRQRRYSVAVILKKSLFKSKKKSLRKKEQSKIKLLLKKLFQISARLFWAQ